MADESDRKEADRKEADKKDGNGLLGDTLKRVFTAGVTAAFMTEESVRMYLQDLKLPKEILSLLLQQANKSKEEIASRVSKEIINMMNKVDYMQEISRFMEGHKFRVSAEIEVIKKQKQAPTVDKDQEPS